MRVLVTLLATLVLAPAATATAATIHSVAGNGALKPLGDGGPATSAALGQATDIAAMPGGGFVLIDGARVRRVGTDGRIATVAGTGKPGFAGDGGPATAARIRPTGLAVQPDGGILIAECLNNRVRRVAPDGVITTVAGSSPVIRGVGSPGFHFKGDGGQAAAAWLACPRDVAAQPDGGFLIDDEANYRVRRVAPDGVITTFAGRRKSESDRGGTTNGDGGPATSADVQPRRIALAADGSLLIAERDAYDVRRVAPDGTITTVAGNGDEGPNPRDGTLATKAPLTPQAIAAMPDGGFLIGNSAENSCVGGAPAVLRVDAGGHISRVAGTTRYVTDPPQGDERRGDGGSPLQADLRGVGGVDVAADGGVLIVDSLVACSDAPVASLVRYVTPETPGLFAANFVTAQDRVFEPGAQRSVDVALSMPGSVTVGVGGSRTQPAPLPAGTSTVALPMPLGSGPTTVELTAVDAAGVEVHDTLQLFPANWLTLARASIDAHELAFNVPRLRDGFDGVSPILGCRRFGPLRVDCRMTENRKRCDGAIAVTLRGSTLWWGEYRCPLRKQPKWRIRPRVLRRRDIACTDVDPWCPRHPFALPFGWGRDSVIAFQGLV